MQMTGALDLAFNFEFQASNCENFSLVLPENKRQAFLRQALGFSILIKVPTFSILSVELPKAPYFCLASDIPHSKCQTINGLNSLDIEPNRRDSLDSLVQLYLV